LFTKENNWKLVTSVSGDPKQWQSSAAPYFDPYLKRLLDPKEIRLDPTQIMQVISTNNTYGQFMPWSHGAGHSCMHLFLGFVMKTQSSPDEPLFMMHHCNVDRLYHLWADCWDYETIPPNEWTPAQYVEINPTPGGTAVEEMTGPSTKQKVRVLPDTKIPYKMGSGTSILIPEASFPMIKDLWSCGEEGNPGWMGLYVRYGPDKMAQALDLAKSCKSGQQWRWVNCGASTSKRGETTPEIEDNESKIYKEFEETFLRKTEEEGISPKTALKEIAMENCLKNPKEEMTPQRASYLRMMGINPSSLDRICDEPSRDPNVSGRQRPMHM
jgi:hypothetical protein